MCFHRIIPIPLHHFLGVHLPWGRSGSLRGSSHHEHITYCIKEYVLVSM